MERPIYDGSVNGAKLERDLGISIDTVVGEELNHANLEWVNQPTPWGPHYHVDKDAKIIPVLPLNYRGSVGERITKHNEVLFTYDGSLTDQELEDSIVNIFQIVGIEPKKKAKNTK